MLRTIQHAHIRPIIRAGQVTTLATPAITLDIGGGCYSASARNSAGKATLTKGYPNVRAGVVIGQAGAAIADGGYFTFNTDPSTGSVVGATVDASGVADDGTFDFMEFSFQNEFTDRTSPLQRVVASSQGMRILAVKISSLAAISIGGTQLATATKASSIYTLTPTNAFARTPLVFATPIATAQKATRVTSKSASSVAIATFSAAEAAQDNDFYALIIGWDRTGDYCRRGAAVQAPFRKPRIEVFRVTGSGTAAIATGSTDATLVDNGTGDYSLTWTKAFAREPIVIVSAKAGRAQCKSAASTTGATIVTFDASGAAADDDFCAVVIGSDVADEH